jgi:phospholipid/cholesterol/gamma-HCH transport system ATP-binding protein
MIAKYQRHFNFTALIVTHDVPEALVASDRVALLNQGRIAFVGTPAEFSSSSNPVVSLFRDSAQALGDSLAEIRRSHPTH